MNHDERWDLGGPSLCEHDPMEDADEKENIVPVKCRCNTCGHIFKESEIVIVQSREYPGAKEWDDYVSPCCLSHNFTELEDES